MKILLVTALFVALSPTSGQAANSFRAKPYLVADNADACFASCASQSASCKRVCPATFNTPCLNACDNQERTCRQGCQRK
jgi:hypothetical protein